jgi:hypothetical protein
MLEFSFCAIKEETKKNKSLLKKVNYESINNEEEQTLNNRIIEDSTNYAEGLFHEEQDFVSNRYEVSFYLFLI